MFLNDLYTIKQILCESSSYKLSVLIQLNPSHEIFKGHFPGLPGGLDCRRKVGERDRKAKSSNQPVFILITPIDHSQIFGKRQL